MSGNQNTTFLKDPRAYLSTIALENPFNLGGAVQAVVNLDDAHDKVVVNLQPLDGSWLYSTTKAKVEVGDPAKPTAFENLGADKVLVGGWVPYKNEGGVKNGTVGIGKLEVPARPGKFDPKLVFTGAMNGCSFVLAEDYSHRLYAVHYPNSSGAKNGFPLLAKENLQHLKSINYETTNAYGPGYGESREELEKKFVGVWSNAYCCLYYDENAAEWRILCQPQLVKALKGGTFDVQLNPGRGLLEI